MQALPLLGRKLQQALGIRDERFHVHVTLARNRGMPRQQAQQLVEMLRQKVEPKKIRVEGFELMESNLHKAGPEYRVVFSVQFNEACSAP